MSGVRENFDGHGVCAEDDYFPRHPRVARRPGGIDGAMHPNTSGHLWGYAPAIVDALRQQLGFPYELHRLGVRADVRRQRLRGDCNTVSGDGDHKLAIAAPPTHPAGLNLPPDIEDDLVNGRLPNSTVYSNSCASNAFPDLPQGQAPREMPRRFQRLHQRRPDLRRLEHLGQLPAPARLGRRGADHGRPRWHRRLRHGRRRVPDVPPPQRLGRRRWHHGVPRGTHRRLGHRQRRDRRRPRHDRAVRRSAILRSVHDPGRGHQRDQRARLWRRLLPPSTRTTIGTINLNLSRSTCQADSQSGYDCGSGMATGARYDLTQLEVVDSNGEWLTDIDESDSGPYSTGGGAATGVAVGSGLREPISNIHLPYSVPASSVVLVTVRSNTYTTLGEECAWDWANFPCSAQARASAQVGFAPDGATGLLVPLTGFVAPVATDTTAPVVTTQLTGTAGSNGWYRSTVSVAITGTDDQGGSGVQSVTTSVDNGQPVTTTGQSTMVEVAGDGVHTVAATATDASGNVSEPVTTTVRIDRGVPGITISPLDDAQYAFNAVVPTDLACTDAVSGIASCTGPATLDTSTAGAHTATFTAIDSAGNAAERTLDYWVLAPADVIDIKIPQLGYSIAGSVATGGFDLRYASNGQLTSVNGTATYVRPDGGRVTVTIAAIRLLGSWVGAVSVSDPSAGVDVTAMKLSKDGVTPVGTNGATGSFTTGGNGSKSRTVNWTITDLG